MITQAPLPGWKNIFLCFFSKPQTQESLSLPWKREGDQAGWLSRSAWSIALISEWRKQYCKKSEVIVWVPDYFCNASLTPLRETGAKLVFYPVTSEMIPDHASCKKMAEQASPDIFILVHYFGKPSASRVMSDFCSAHNSWLIEDATHVLKPVKGVGTQGDFVLYSPHKHLPVPDGALLIICPNGPAKFEQQIHSFSGSPETWTSQLHELQQKMGSLIKSSKVHAAIWFCKRIIQKLSLKFWHTSTLPFLEQLKNVNTVSPLIGPSQSMISKKLLSTLVTDLNIIARKRERNQLLLDYLFSSSGDYLFSSADRPTKREWIPYLSEYSATTAEAGKAYCELHERGLPVSTWPDLPPEVITDNSNYPNAWLLRHNRVYLSVQQSIRYKALIKKLDKEEQSKKNIASVNIDWNIANRENWQEWLTQAGKSNILQSWEYGSTKSVQEGWHAKRGVFFSNGEPIAVVQMLEKKFFNMFTINRVNRGPLFLRKLTFEESRMLYKELASLGNIKKGQVLFVAPEMHLSGSNLLLMAKSGFKQFTIRPWESIWLDLTLELDVLRKKLDSKWRNMLNFSEKTGLQLEIGESNELFSWLMGHYEQLMKEKKFGGLSLGFLSHYRKNLSGKSKLLIFRAVMQGGYVAGICVVCHGTAATYLIGWNGDHGRSLKANQFLLWNAIVHLKEIGINYFDLGGVNETDVPGITAFKAGLNGDFYELVGEYIKW